MFKGDVMCDKKAPPLNESVLGKTKRDIHTISNFKSSKRRGVHHGRN